MTLSTIICGYIYAGFLVIKAALEAGLLYAKAIITTLNSFVMAVENAIKNTCLVAFDAALAGYQILCKYLTEWIMKKTRAKELLDWFCKSIFKCSYVLAELVNPNSPITKTLVANFEYDAEPQAELYQNLMIFDNFRKQICTNGFTFMWGLNYIRDQGEEILAQINEWVDIITRNRLRIKKRLESYLYAIEDFGIFDLLNRLHAFFNCVLDSTIDSCSSIATSQNFYKKCTGAMHIVDIGGGQYKLTDSWVKQKLGVCNNATRKLNGLSAQLTKILMDAGITSKNLANAQAAFNLANFVRDTKRALDGDDPDWTQIPGIKLISRIGSNAKNFGEKFGTCMKKIGEAIGDIDIDLSWDNILEHLKIEGDDSEHLNIVYVNSHPDGTPVRVLLTKEDLDLIVDENVMRIKVDNSTSQYAEDLLSRFYWTADGRIASMGYVVDQIANDGTDKDLINEVNAKADIVNDLSDITHVVTQY